MEELRNKVSQVLKNMPYPDSSHIKPPTKHAAEIMVKNLRAAAKKNSDGS